MKTIKLLGLLFISTACFSQSTKEKLHTAFSIFEKDEQFKYASIGLLVINSNTGEIVFDKNQIAENWKLALCEGQDLKDLKNEEVYGYLVESGMGSFMDKDAQNSLNQLEKDLFNQKGDLFMGIYEEFFHSHFFNENGAIDQFAILKPYDDKKENIIAFETGYGEGFYATYIGYSKENQVVKLISEFIEIGMD